MTAALDVDDLHKAFGPIEALRGVSLRVEAGQVVGLLGPNGAGKSTLVKVLCGLVRPSAGSARVSGHRAGSTGARASLGYLAELFRFPPWLSVEEVVAFHQQLAGSRGGQAERARLIERVGMGHAASRRVDALSKGMQQRLGIAQALVGEPQVVILDEPTSALDPEGRRMVRELVADLRVEGRAVLLSSHLLAEVEQVCDEVVILRRGEVAGSGSVDGLASEHTVTIVTGSGTEVHVAARADVPGLVAGYVERGEEVFEVRPDVNRLEEAYLDLVEDR